MGESVNQDMILGEMRGQMRELVHTVNNLSTKFDALTREVVALGPLAVQIAELRSDVELLKKVNNQQAGAHSVIASIVKSPALGWFVGAVLAVWAFVSGKPS